VLVPAAAALARLVWRSARLDRGGTCRRLRRAEAARAASCGDDEDARGLVGRAPRCSRRRARGDASPARGPRPRRRSFRTSAPLACEPRTLEPAARSACRCSVRTIFVTAGSRSCTGRGAPGLRSHASSASASFRSRPTSAHTSSATAAKSIMRRSSDRTRSDGAYPGAYLAARIARLAGLSESRRAQSEPREP
jgi:hypothetical protein